MPGAGAPYNATGTPDGVGDGAFGSASATPVSGCGWGGAPYGCTTVSGSRVFGQPATATPSVVNAITAARDNRFDAAGVADTFTAARQNGHTRSSTRTCLRHEEQGPNDIPGWYRMGVH